MKPANAKARALFGKLERLADPANNGTPDEIEAAKRKLERLKSRFDFSAPAAEDTMDIFAGLKVKRAFRRAAHVYAFQHAEFDVANAVKWAIERATGARCLFRGDALLAEVSASFATKLAKLARHITESFNGLLERFGRLQGVTASDRSLFVRGLYDGMMDDGRGAGEALPRRPVSSVPRGKAKKAAVTRQPGLAVHPYTVALGLGRQIRFAAPLEEIAAELERATQPALAPGVHRVEPTRPELRS